MRRREFLKSTLAVAALTAVDGWSADATDISLHSPVPRGKYWAFWRCSAALGPYLEQGEGLVQIPDYLLHGDFPYKRRPYPLEVPFADQLSVVRLLGGYSGDRTGIHDLAYRDTQGEIRHRMQLLKPRLQPYLDSGYTNLTLVLDNVPWCFPEKPVDGPLGQSSPPRNPHEWYRFIQTVCEQLVQILGSELAEKLRFRVGTENDSTDRWNGTQAQYQLHYDTTVAAVESVLRHAQVGLFNISSPTIQGQEQLDNVKGLAVAEHCFHERNLFDGRIPTTFDWVAFSDYYRPGDDPEANAIPCRDVWNLFVKRVPQLKVVSREIHEFGIAPWSEKGIFASAEPGALGAALTCQLMLRLRDFGVHRLWHWGQDYVFDQFRSQSGELLQLYTSYGWLLCVLERMIGGDAYSLVPLEVSPFKTRHIISASVKKNAAILLISAYNTAIGESRAEVVHFHLPSEFLYLERLQVRFVHLSRQTAVHDQIRRDLATAGLLAKPFLELPNRLGIVNQMGGRAAEIFVAGRWNSYVAQWTDSLTLKPVGPSICTVHADSSGLTYSVRMSPPGLVALMVGPWDEDH